MAVTEKSNIFDQVSIAAQIIDGSIKIDSIKEFDNVLKLFPTDPALLRAYADLMVKKKRAPAGRVVKKAGDSEEDLYFVVSGILRATTYQPVAREGQTVYTKSTVNLTENTFFGEIYPFENKQRSQSYIEAITQTELIKLSKINLMKICVNIPEVEHALADLYETRITSGVIRNFSRQRVGNRQQLPVRVHLQVRSGDSASPPLDLKEYSRDISIGGTCVVLDAECQGFDSFDRYVQDAGVQIVFPSRDLTLNVKGTVVWSREIDMEEKTTMALGIQFQDMSPKSRGMLLGFANNMGSTE